MKKALLFIALLISGLGLNAQGVSKEKQNKNVLIEMFTDKGDSYGPTCHNIINQIIANNPGNVFTVNMHVNLFPSTNYPNMNLDINKEYMYGLNALGIPSSHVNRSTNKTIDPRTDTNTVNQQLDQTAEVNINGWVTIDDPSSRIATITVEAYYTADSKYNTNYLTIMMLQDSIIGSQSGAFANQEQMIGDQYCHMHVLRDVITDTWGDEITTTTAGSLVSKQYVYEIPEVIGDPNGIEVDLDNIRFIAFITETKYQILNVCEIHPAYSINYDGYSLSYRKASDEKCTVVGITHPASKMAITIPSSETINGTICSVTSIGNNTFKNCSNLTSIDIPESVTSIGESAFEGCSSLVSLEIPSSVTSIENNTFKNCSNLTSIDIPESVTSIGESAFEGCSSLVSLEIPSSVTSIENNTFKNCSSMTSIDIPESVTSIGESAFEGCSSLVSLEIPSSVTSIENNTFKNCSSLTSIDIPESVTSIGESAFEGCSSLVSLEIPSSVTSIENNTFKNCSSLTSIDIPESVTSIGESAFEGCSSLKSITSFAKKVPTTADNAFDNCPEDMIIYVPEISLNAYKINYPWYLYKILAIGDNEEEPEEPGESIEELSSSINVYPNPVNNIIYIETEFKVEEVIVNDVYGRRQDTESPSHQAIDVSNLTSGVYFMKVATSEGEVVKRILKK